MINTQTAKFDGLTFNVPPGVFNPSDFISSKVFAKFVSSLDLKNKSVLDMGCGSGFISVIAASRGAQSTAADINPSAVEAAKLNAEQNNFENKITAVQSNLFDNIKESPSYKGGVPHSGEGVGFDLIFFNPPYLKGKPANDFELAFKGGENYELIKDFAAHSKKFLKPAGSIYIILSSDMDYHLIEPMFRSHGFEFNLAEKHAKLFETFYIFKAFSL